MILAKLRGVKFQSGLSEPEVFEFHEFSEACLTVEVKYAVKCSIADHFKRCKA